jgi:hypothetical protein
MAPAAPIKRADCQHQWPNERHCVPAVVNSYYCEDCDKSWTDECSCACDDECPGCGKDYTPENSEEIAACACDYL